MLKAHFTESLAPERLAELQSQLNGEVQVTAGPSLPSPADYEILVSPTPSRAEVTASPRLRALIIPYTGMAEDVRALMAEFPQVAVHNSHHPAAATAEMAMTLLLAAARRLIPADRGLRAGDWSMRRQPNLSVMLEGKTVLVLGYGQIGQRVARVCQALGMRVLATRRRANLPAVQPEAAEIHPASDLPLLLPRADALIVTLPLTSETRGLIGAAELALLPRGALLVNVGRGPIVDEAALYAALQSGALGAAGLDVWYHYPPDEAPSTRTFPSAYPFHELDNVILSPHRGGLTSGGQARGLAQVAGMLNAAARGEPMPNRVDVSVGY
jgi:phosphoglycerate dehydrogenase-like enzyme